MALSSRSLGRLSLRARNRTGAFYYKDRNRDNFDSGGRTGFRAVWVDLLRIRVRVSKSGETPESALTVNMAMEYPQVFCLWLFSLGFLTSAAQSPDRSGDPGKEGAAWFKVFSRII